MKPVSDVKPSAPRREVTLKDLVGSGDKVVLFTLPFLIVALILNATVPSLSHVEPSATLRTVSVVVASLGVVLWIWSVVLILEKVPRGELITTGPFALMKHPIYTSVALLVLPWIGLLLNTWSWALVGIGMYVGSRIYAPAEEAKLSETFGARWDAYRRSVVFPWL